MEVLKQCGVPSCPQDAIAEIKSSCIYVSQRNGGDGCVRDVIEQVMRLHGTWE
jgi:3-deoxy-D-manno-octulosonate 8-phosphate phosphatase (KDO 8-P phosphatase)